MAHNNRDIAQEAAANFLEHELWDFVDEVFDKHGWDEMIIVKISKRDAVKRIVRSSLSAFKYSPNVSEIIREEMGIMGSFGLHVKRSKKEVKSIWNLPFERRGNVVIPDGCASSLILDSIAKLDSGRALSPKKYASLGLGV